MNVLLECIELLNAVQCILYVPIVLLESINLILAHYAGIFDRGLNALKDLLCKLNLYAKDLQSSSVKI